MGKKAEEETEGEQAILSFLNQQNRPFNVQNIIDALSPRLKFMKKALAQRCLDILSANNEIACKEFGKVKIYLAKQDQFDIPSDEELREMDLDIAALDQKRRTLVETISQLSNEKHALFSSLKDADIHESIEALGEELRKQNRNLRKKVDILEAGQHLASRDDFSTASKEYEKFYKEWRNRKRKCIDIVNQICEGIETKPSTFMENVGLETDEEHGVEFDRKPKILRTRK